jgi:hypothetical protein
MEPAALFPCFREHVPQGFPEPERAVADGENGRGHAAAAAVAQQIRPGLGGFTVTIGQGEELLAADNPAPEPRNCSSAGPKSPVDSPCGYSSGSTSLTCRDFRAQAGRIAEENRCRHQFPGRVACRSREAPSPAPRPPR